MRPAPTLLVLCVALVAHAEDDRERRAREELERQLSAMVEKAPTSVKVEFQGLDEPNYELTEVAVDLDGQPLSLPSLATLGAEGLHALAPVEVKPGSHVLKVRMVCRSKASIVVSDEGGYSWTLAGQNSFDVNNGIQVQVKVVPTRVPQARELAKRFTLALPAKPVMMAKLDDGKMPEPPPKPVLAPEVVMPDAGPPVVKPVKAEEKPALVEKGVVEAQPKSPKVAPSVAAKEPREPAHRASASKVPKRVAVSDAPPIDALKRVPPTPEVAPVQNNIPPPVLPVPAPPPINVPPPDVAVPSVPVDAPLAAPVAPAPVTPEPSSSPSWPLYVGGGIGVLVLLVFLATRRRE